MRLSLVNKILILPFIIAVGLILALAGLLDFFGVPCKPTKAAGFK